MSKELVSKLQQIQETLKAPKNQFNKFGGYNYRNCEDILEAVKPLLAEHGLVLTLSDEVVEKGHAALGGHSEGDSETKNYVRATATVTDGEDSISVSAYARESYEKKGMDAAQITGSASSYARKYALNGLFLIDDTKDADATNDHGKSESKQTSTRGSKKKVSKRSSKKSDPKKEVEDSQNKEESQEEQTEESTEQEEKKSSGRRRGGFRRVKRD